MFDPFAGGALAPAPGWLSMLNGRAPGFAPDSRFGPAAGVDPSACLAAERAAAEREEEARRSVAEAFAAGLAKGRAEGDERLAAERAAFERLRLSVARLDETMRGAFCDRMAETVVALCEATLAPLALDRDALQRRCTRAALLLGEAQERLALHLHPDDIASLEPQFVDSWTIVPRADFERGTLRIEGGEAGVVDGPAEWRAALEAALTC